VDKITSLLSVILYLCTAHLGAKDVIQVGIGTQDTTINCAAGGPVVRELVAWIPLSILMFATAEQSIIYICFIGAFYPILLSTIHGVKGIDRRLLNAAQSLGAGRWDTFWEVILPGAFPSIVTGLSIGMGTCWFSLITAEMMAGQYGIGYLTWESYTLQNYPQIVVGMVLIGLLGMLSSLLVRKMGSLLMPWTRRGGANG
jgi:NitT/TauT family transport system permease protein